MTDSDERALRIKDELRAKINASPLLQSLLYDIDLMPEQIKPDDLRRWGYVEAIAGHCEVLNAEYVLEGMEWCEQLCLERRDKAHKQEPCNRGGTMNLDHLMGQEWMANLLGKLIRCEISRRKGTAAAQDGNGSLKPMPPNADPSTGKLDSAPVSAAAHIPYDGIANKAQYKAECAHAELAGYPLYGDYGGWKEPSAAAPPNQPDNRTLALDEIGSLEWWFKQQGHDEDSATLISLQVIRKALTPDLSSQPASKPETAKQRFDKFMGNTQETPIERLRFFCSLTMNGQDWLDVEPFFDALAAPPADTQDAKRHRFAMRHVSYYSVHGEFIVDCRKEQRPGSNSSLDYEKSIDAAMQQEKK